MTINSSITLHWAVGTCVCACTTSFTPTKQYAQIHRPFRKSTLSNNYSTSNYTMYFKNQLKYTIKQQLPQQKRLLKSWLPVRRLRCAVSTHKAVPASFSHIISEAVTERLKLQRVWIGTDHSGWLHLNGSIDLFSKTTRACGCCPSAVAPFLHRGNQACTGISAPVWKHLLTKT